ncbi:GlxA family transcriptional regulator [uncultured Roseovarius sp.]|uniref:GlxA family transcriptional regulator n=1 Tax=uncultured Roseovarius sp. TaxID=293344 RepID=UPI0026064EDD|nr:GlxA family transcriptional regulator [uncultured Roseovarius sp.]
MNERSFVPKGAASFRVDFDGPPKDFYFLLLPKLTMLAFSSAVEPLRVANQVTNRELYRWFVMTEDGKPVRCSNGIVITPDSGLQNLPKSATAFVCSGIEPGESTSPRITAWLSRQRAFGCRTGGICTGAFALAKAGLLEDRVFTLHWENRPAFVESFIGLEPTGNLYENDDGLMTCGGGSAATDMMLAMIERDHGKDLAVVVADMCIHFRSDSRKSLQKSAYSVALSSRNQHLITAMQFMNENLENPVEIDEVATEADISRRQLERLFKKYVGVSPAQFYIDQRISRAHALLNETTLSVNEIAVATGFSSSSQLSLRFRKRFGKSPGAFRKSWAEQAG